MVVKNMVVNICPKCRSKNVKKLTNIDYKVIAFGVNPVFKCLDCGFVGEIFPEVDDDRGESKFRRKRPSKKGKFC